MSAQGDRKLHAIVGRARRLGFVLAVAGAALAIAGKRMPDTPALKWIALIVIVLAVTLLLAAITHRMVFQKLDLLADEAAEPKRHADEGQHP
ncbi:hypothetical protein [Sphingomonas cavernae]|nr:hypothetical protein [Sphingomonas cavernae]